MDNFITECKFTILGSPKTKSNYSLTTKSGKKILPKNSPFAIYEKTIVNVILDEVGEKKFKGRIICVLNVFFKHENQHPDLNNMTKSVCDGIEKSRIIENDKDIVCVYLTESYDYDNPRVEVEIYDDAIYKPNFSIEKKNDAELAKSIEIESNKKKSSSKKRKSKETVIICSNCDKKTDKLHSKPIAGTKEHICLRCLFVS